MPNIPLTQIDDNPFRDFELHPLEAPQVERLKASIDADGFWASVVARKVGDRYQIAFGHHRIAAARDLGRTDVPIEVRPLSDVQMVRMLASENATQRGSTAAACLDAVAAISKILAYHLLRWENEATFLKNIGKVRLDYPSCRGRLEAGSGIGEDCILGFAAENSFSRVQVRDALHNLKDSGRIADIITAASAAAASELRAEQEAAEQALAEAKRKEEAAKTKRERQAAAKATKKAQKTATGRRKSTEATAKAVEAVQRKPIIYDARCAHLFRIDSHAATFRQVVTGYTFQAYLKVNKQFEFAQSVLAALREKMPNKEITAADIRTECWSRIETGLGIAKGQMRTAPERPYLEEIKEGLNLLRRAEGDFKRGVALLIRGFQLGEQLNTKQAERLTAIENTFITGWNGLKEYRTPKQHLRLVGEDKTDE